MKLMATIAETRKSLLAERGKIDQALDKLAEVERMFKEPVVDEADGSDGADGAQDVDKERIYLNAAPLKRKGVKMADALMMWAGRSAEGTTADAAREYIEGFHQDLDTKNVSAVLHSLTRQGRLKSTGVGRARVFTVNSKPPVLKGKSVMRSQIRAHSAEVNRKPKVVPADVAAAPVTVAPKGPVACKPGDEEFFAIAVKAACIELDKGFTSADVLAQITQDTPSALFKDHAKNVSKVAFFMNELVDQGKLKRTRKADPAQMLVAQYAWVGE